MHNFIPEALAHKIVSFCIEHKLRFVFISGNGGAGKTELSKLIRSETQKYGPCNTIDMDEFVVDTKLRNSASLSWIDVDNGLERSGKYSTTFAASYFLQNIKAILCNLERGNNYWHWPKRAKSSKESILEYKADALITIVEGIGSVFIEKDNSKTLSIFMQCDGEIEINRRIKRAKYSNEQDPNEVRRLYEERNSQFKANILPYADEHNLILQSRDDFSLDVIKDELGVLCNIS
ncbi:MAG: zeta toxin family protein [Clostridiales bacterium]|nr:zeta toxin family protein [Clostridiales bacterium]